MEPVPTSNLWGIGLLDLYIHIPNAACNFVTNATRHGIVLEVLVAASVHTERSM